MISLKKIYQITLSYKIHRGYMDESRSRRKEEKPDRAETSAS